MTHYDKEQFVQKYWDLISTSKDPVLIADGGPYIISPDAVRGLRFSDNGMSFSATFNTVERLVTLYKDDIQEIIEQGEGNE